MSRRRRRSALWVVGAILLGSVLPVTPSGAATSTTTEAGPVSITKTITRSNIAADGISTNVESDKFTASVSATRALQNLQDVDVSWTGAHPTGAIEPDYNAAIADTQEYPVAILECRGVDGSAATGSSSPAASPQTCWTHGNDERYQAVSYMDYAPWRLDADASAAERAAVVGRPNPVPAACGTSIPTNEYWVPFVAANGTSYDYGESECASIPPEDYPSDSSVSSVPPNATFAASTINGTGSVKFDIQTDEENASLGCSASVACTLEIIPILGLSCDPYGVSPAAAGIPAADVPPASKEVQSAAACEAAGAYPAGSVLGSQPESMAVTGSLWWSASNWANRVSVPLSFADESNACTLVGAGAPVYIYGSELMTQATGQWAPTFCGTKGLFNLTHVQTSEPLAKSLLGAGSVDAAFSSESPPGGFSTPVDQAPVAVTGFSISYSVDDAKGNAVADLKLDPRLLAKLLTESYTQLNFNTYKSGQFPYLAGNPVNITQDPEFQALNPGIARQFGSQAEVALSAGAASLIVLDGGSDVMYALTSYIESDPEARAWLAGTPDPWGMRVNKYYNTSLNPSFTLPTSTWPLLDQTIPDFDGQEPCETANPSPWLPLVASPTATLALSALAVQFASPTGKVECNDSDPNNPSDLSALQFTAAGRQQPGARFTIGLTSLGEAARYDLTSAELQTSDVTPPTSATGPDLTDQFSNATGRTFVAPTQASLLAAAKTLVADPSTDTWTVPYSTLGSTPSAYPGTMVVNADIPTSGLPSTLAVDYGKLLHYAAGAGQLPGTADGELPLGYLPMTAANGLGAEVNYTLRAAQDVTEQTGQVTPLVAPPVVPPTKTPESTAPAPQPASVPQSSSQPTAAATPTSTPLKHAPVVTSQVPSTPAAALPLIKTVGVKSSLTGLILPLLLAVGLLGALLSGGSYIRLKSLGRRG
ncbi:MAG TPA: hypothetical protein VK816_00080 [Jatrophihabitantaceae bacterium]|jgi:hypothetical protein|nr:hypothetical protein [Jatrophihabitantaceae bacterium]